MFYHAISPMFLGWGLVGGVGASPQELNVTKYIISLLYKSIELAIRRV